MLSPNLAKRNPGDDVTFTCASEESTRWYHKTLKATPISTHLTKHSIKSLRVSDAGDYYCYGRYKIKSKKRDAFLSKATLRIYGKQYSYIW